MWKNWLLYVLAIGCFGVFTVLYIKQSAFIVLMVVIVIPLVYSVITCILAKRKCRVHFEKETVTLEKNKKTEIGIVIENSSGINLGNAAWVSVSVYNGMGTRLYRGKKKFRLGLGSQRISFEFTPKFSGFHEIVLEKMKIYSGFSMLCSTFHSGERKSFLIMPEYKEFSIHLENLHEEKEGESDRFSAVRPGSDPSELYDIRNYRPGDRINRINWKFTAKNGQLMVQDYGFPIACDTAVLIDISGEKDAEKVERAIEILYYVMLNYIMEKKLFYVIWKDFREERLKRKMISGDGDVYDLFHDMFCSDMGKMEKELEELYSAQFEGEFLSRGVFIYTGRKSVDEETTRMKLRADRMEFVRV